MARIGLETGPETLPAELPKELYRHQIRTCGCWICCDKIDILWYQLLWRNWYSTIPIVTPRIDVCGTWQYDQYLQKKTIV